MAPPSFPLFNSDTCLVSHASYWNTKQEPVQYLRQTFGSSRPQGALRCVVRKSSVQCKQRVVQAGVRVLLTNVSALAGLEPPKDLLANSTNWIKLVCGRGSEIVIGPDGVELNW